MKRQDRVRFRGATQGDRPVTGTVVEVDADASPEWGGTYTVELDEGLTLTVLNRPESVVKLYGNALESL